MRSPETRPEDLPLHEGVRWLAAALGRVIRRLEGEEAFDTVDRLRVASRARRRGEADALILDDLLRDVDGLSVERCAIAARAFTLFFLLINTAKQTHRVRRRKSVARADRRWLPAGSSAEFPFAERRGRTDRAGRSGAACGWMPPNLTAPAINMLAHSYAPSHLNPR
ncbi:MAG: hypothetical protein H0W30_16100 [Gemmatimonadaceae bacterium]|nr:hypothetical protein [Gemmatimonadaceae bacterium]MDQ3516868.1 phosphoenolpyruvate carboxylase [Gemmatimonadota bacterium]